MLYDQRHIGKGLNVVQGARPAPEAFLRGVDVLGPGLAHPSLQGVHQSGRLSGDKGAGTPMNAHIKIKASAQNILTQEAVLPGLLEGERGILDR